MQFAMVPPERVEKGDIAMEGLSQGRAASLVVNNSIAGHKGDEIGFDDAVALVKQHPGAILIRTKSGSCMVRLANGSVLGVTPPTGTAAGSPEGRAASATKLQQEIDRLNKVILINKNTLDKAHHHLRDKDLEIKQLKAKLEEKDRENHIQNKVITGRGKRIEELTAQVIALETKLVNLAAEQAKAMAKAGSGEKRKSMRDFALSNRGAAVGSETELQPCSRI